MNRAITRRSVFAAIAPLTLPALLGSRPALAEDLSPYSPTFPSQDPELARETVLYAHSDAQRVLKLVEARPELANAAIDWGFGDWESAIGAAAHMGRRDMAEILLEHGARPDLYTYAMLGHLAAVKAMVESVEGVQRTPGPHGITLLAHARAGGDESAAVVDYLEGLGDADIRTDSKPLPEDKSAYLGTYRYDRGERDTFEIVETQGTLGLKSPEKFPRALFHLGDNEFHPGGARSVRVNFSFEGRRAERVEIYDPQLSIRALREP